MSWPQRFTSINLLIKIKPSAMPNAGDIIARANPYPAEESMPNLNDLSERELEILNLLAEGKSNKEIASELYISTNTVKVHLRNIFSKLEVSSRTEAVLFVLRPDNPVPLEEIVSGSNNSHEDDIVPLSLAAPSNENGIDDEPDLQNDTVSLIRASLVKNRWLFLIILLGIGVLLSTGAGLGRFFQPAMTPSPEIIDASPSETSRWQFRKDLPAPKTGLAVTIYEEQIYAIGGENTQVLSELARYDPVTDRWEPLLPKPTAVTDIQAAVTGGKIYVPGGRLESGEPTNILDIYNPQEGTWTQGSSLPVALSAYALVAFEGDLYLFGGWNGNEYTDQALRYDPAQNQWYPLTAMPIARGFAGVAIAGGKIYILGGYDGENFLSNNNIYSPELEGTEQSPWTEGAPLPAGRSAMGAANIVDSIYLIGGENPNEEFFTQMKYSPKDDSWVVVINPLAEPWAHMGVVPIGTSLYALGGSLNNQPTNRNLIYQVIFSISIPIAP
jgi:DNA-binding CsgD family transcriptional regulator/N-acetylneuraminic acid mutarotase